MSKEDDERWRNLLFYKTYATNKEMEEMAPFVFVALAIISVICLLIYFSKA